MAAASSASSWPGAAPISEHCFSFANGVLFAEASGKHKHRRASREELTAHFSSGSDRDHPAHWFEAQLAHYGLKPSKTKSVARMRLFDALQAGSLAVPSHVALLEGRLKKEWTKQDRAAKKAAPPAADVSRASTSKKPQANSAAKRKADAMSGTEETGSASAAPRTRVKQTARRGSSWQHGRGRQELTTTTTTTTTVRAFPSPEPDPPATAPKKFATKQTARCNRGRGSTARGRMVSGGSSHDASPPSPSPPPPPTMTAARPKQMARRGRGQRATPRGRIQQGNSYDSHLRPDIKPEFDDDDDIRQRPPGGPGHLPPLGLINGGYDISCPYVDSEWPRYNSDFDLVLRLAGSSMWGRFDLGVISGIIFFEQRPYASSSDAVPFTWRGREDQGPIMYGDSNYGWIRFLGGGRIEGEFDYQSIAFHGVRDAGSGTMSEVSTRSLRDEWEGYSEDTYETENRARWGGGWGRGW